MFSSFLTTCCGIKIRSMEHAVHGQPSSTFSAMCKLSLHIHSVQQLSSWNAILLEELIHSQLVKKSPHLLKTNGSLPFSQHSTMCPYPVPNQFNRRSHSIPLCSILILSTHLCLGLTRSLIMKFPHQNLVCVSLLSNTCHMSHPFHRP
jgi:hypothetical protein